MKQRVDLTLDPTAVHLLHQLAQAYFDGDESRTVKAALESLAAHTGCEGWAVAGYSLLGLRAEEGRLSADGRLCELSCRPIFARQSGAAREK